MVIRGHQLWNAIGGVAKVRVATEETSAVAVRTGARAVAVRATAEKVEVEGLTVCSSALESIPGRHGQ